MQADPLHASAAGTLQLGGELTVNRLGYGAMRITGRGIWGEPADRKNALRVLRRAVELGINFIDTADSYGPGTSELLIAEALHPYPPGLVIATKGGLLRPGPDDWQRDARPHQLRTACEASLKRLRVECIDVYQLHAIDPKVPMEESLGALAKLREEGKIRLVGVSNFTVEDLERGRKIVPIVSVQNRYNASDRRYDDVIDYCERHALAFIPWYPLAAGEHATSVTESELDQIARRHQLRPAQAAIAWLLARSRVMLPIPGTASIEHLEQNVAAAAVKL